jgi:hypothetical protein
MDNLGRDFGEALDALRDGKAVYRTGWNAGGQYIYLVPAAEYPAVTEVAKAEFGEKVPYGQYLAIKTVQHNVVPWLASQTDLLAEDWQIVKNEEESN